LQGNIIWVFSARGAIFHYLRRLFNGFLGYLCYHFWLFVDRGSRLFRNKYHD